MTENETTDEQRRIAEKLSKHREQVATSARLMAEQWRDILDRLGKAKPPRSERYEAGSA